MLIVDDHPTFRRFARQLLEEAGFVVVGEAVDGAGALASVRMLRPDVVLLDVLLPDMSGLAVSAMLAERVDAPLVVLTSSRSTRELGPAVDTCGSRGFIPKELLSGTALCELVRCR